MIESELESGTICLLPSTLTTRYTGGQIRQERADIFDYVLVYTVPSVTPRLYSVLEYAGEHIDLSQ